MAGLHNCFLVKVHLPLVPGSGLSKNVAMASPVVMTWSEDCIRMVNHMPTIFTTLAKITTLKNGMAICTQLAYGLTSLEHSEREKLHSVEAIHRLGRP
jgi:hypothetical protein